MGDEEARVSKALYVGEESVDWRCCKHWVSKPASGSVCECVGVEGCLHQHSLGDERIDENERLTLAATTINC
jgi:hypothetical protein